MLVLNITGRNFLPRGGTVPILTMYYELELIATLRGPLIGPVVQGNRMSCVRIGSKSCKIITIS